MNGQYNNRAGLSRSALSFYLLSGITKKTNPAAAKHAAIIVSMAQSQNIRAHAKRMMEHALIVFFFVNIYNILE